MIRQHIMRTVAGIAPLHLLASARVAVDAGFGSFEWPEDKAGDYVTEINKETFVVIQIERREVRFPNLHTFSRRNLLCCFPVSSAGLYCFPVSSAGHRKTSIILFSCVRRWTQENHITVERSASRICTHSPKGICQTASTTCCEFWR
eukprot:SAG31_NODE_2989_length_4813_cov_8.205346_3_plen_147_part_00